MIEMQYQSTVNRFYLNQEITGGKKDICKSYRFSADH